MLLQSATALLLSLTLPYGAAYLYPPITVDTTIPEFIHSLDIGASVESHFVTTNDGYILETFRLPAKPTVQIVPDVVYFQHGILASAWCWLDNIDGLAPAIWLWEQGFDVWLGNSRGNIFGQNHTKLKVHSKDFWNFTFEEMGEKDLPATIDTILSISKANCLQYVGWSQANTAMFIGALSSKPYTTLSGSSTTAGEFIKKHVKHHHALSPVVYLSHTTSAFLKLVSEAGVGALLEATFPYDFLSGSRALSLLEHWVCDFTLGAICKLTVDFFCGVSNTDSKAIIDNRFVKHFPAGTSVKDMNHFSQYMLSKDMFDRYDYGEKGNIKEYGQPTPPVFDLKRYPLHVTLFAATHDALVAPEDLQFLQDVLPTSSTTTLSFDGFSHLTWLVGKQSSAYWLDEFSAAVHNNTLF